VRRIQARQENVVKVIVQFIEDKKEIKVREYG
jgi:hypothetical protein